MPDVQRSQRRRIGVLGLWHLGSVITAGLAACGYEVIAVDPDRELVEGLTAGRPAVSEPGLAELLADGAARISFAAEPDALNGLDRAWVAFDTPVDEEDSADVGWVLAQAQELLTGLAQDALVLVSSQLPVGSVAELAARCAARRGQDDLRFACVPENLRLGQALESFRAPDRVVVGVRCERDRLAVAELLAPLNFRIEWMGVESAEMTKHALNGFLATSVAFINEVAAVCESVGADAAEVSRGLKSESRIGPRAYLAPGDSFAGGTLARDIVFLRELAARHALPSDVFTGVERGNSAHKSWARRKLLSLLGSPEGDTAVLADAVIAMWGLTYKPGTSTLRRSSAVELCRWLTDAGASVQAHDPAVAGLPAELSGQMKLCEDARAAIEGASALVVCTPWPEYRQFPAQTLRSAMATPVVIDAGGFLSSSLGEDPGIVYVRVGSAAPAGAPVIGAEAPR